MIDTFAHRLRQLRKEKGITQESLGYIAGVNRSAVANWEKGIRCPSPMVLRNLAIYFNVSSDYLYGRTNERRQVIVSPASEIDLSKLNADGMKMLAEFYRFLINDSKYRAD
ncbi:MAG: helix-turn-helix domain-containing protein [Clostridia bacterium]